MVDTEYNDNIYARIISKILTSYEESKKNPNFMGCFIIYSIFFIFILITPFYLYRCINLAYSINQEVMNSAVFYILFIVILFFGMMFLENQSKVLPNNRNVNTIVAFTTMIMMTIVLGCAIYFYNYNSSFGKTYTMYADIVLYTIVFLIIIVSLALVYKIFINSLRRQTGIIGFTINFIFFIPCLFGDFIEFLKFQFRITPNIVFILFILEILLIIAFFYIPTLIDSAINKDKLNILPNAVFVNRAISIGNNDNLSPLITKDIAGSEVKTARANYGLSMWIYLNQQSNQSHNPRLINIFSYGTKDSMKPQVSYFEKGMHNSNKNIYRITFAGPQESVNSDVAVDTSYDIELTSQKWNHLFFNYHSNSVDLFINGILERTYEMNGRIPQYGPLDIMTVGEDGGLDGAVCNVTYYKNEQTKFQITNLYNLLMNKNPPINNII
jgi:Concanavalin A-like lectin/glucanases superfamily